jgi:hypothetical protein
MADTTTAGLTELQAINRMLAGIGQAPITQAGLTTVANPDVAIAQETLYEVSRQIQSEGWAFNKEYNVIMQTNTSNKIVVGPDVMQVDASHAIYRGGLGAHGSTSTVYQNGDYGNAVYNANLDLIVKQYTVGTTVENRIYDKRNKTDTFNRDIQCTVIYYRVFEACPPSIQYYIVDAATALLCQRIIGDDSMYQMLQERTMESRTYALQYETEQGDYSFFGAPVSGQYYVPYEPFDTLRRGFY